MTGTENQSLADEAAEGLEKVTVSSNSTADETPCTVSTNSSLASSAKSALQENIERKGKNAYYFAHAHKANGPKWDGKAEPKLLGYRSLSADEKKMKGGSFDYHKSNITSYAFSDEGMSVKLYITMENVGEKCTDDDISLDFTENSFSLVLHNYKEEPQCLSFRKLTAHITNVSYKTKKDRIIVTLKKEKDGEWHTINDKGPPDHELV
jgi:hypothetical protein